MMEGGKLHTPKKVDLIISFPVIAQKHSIYLECVEQLEMNFPHHISDIIKAVTVFEWNFFMAS